MFKIYRNNRTRFLEAKINWPRPFSDVSRLQMAVTFDSNLLPFLSLPNRREAQISYPRGMVLWDNSPPSPQFAGFPNQVPFLAPTSHLSIYWLVAWWAEQTCGPTTPHMMTTAIEPRSESQGSHSRNTRQIKRLKTKSLIRLEVLSQ